MNLNKEANAPSDARVGPMRLWPLMFEAFVCSMAVMAFVAIAGPLGRVLGLEPWQVGLAVTAAGLAWMVMSRVWGIASDRRGRRSVLLLGLAGFAISYALLCIFIQAALVYRFAPVLVVIGLVFWRGLAGVFYAAVPVTATALIADNVEPARRAGTMAMLGAASGSGIVFGPAFAGLLAPYGIGLPLYIIAVLPVIALVVLWRVLPRTEHHIKPDATPLRITDARIRHPLAVTFFCMSSVAIAQICVGFYAIDKLGLTPEDGARAAGIALACVGIALVLSQTLVRKLGWPPARFIRIGCTIGVVGFLSVILAPVPEALWASYFVAASGMGCVWPSVSALAANAVGPHEQGAAAGSISAMQGLAIIVGPLAGTAIYALDMTAPYLLIGIALAAAALWPHHAEQRAMAATGA